MAVWPASQTVLTKKGLELKAKLQGGAQMVFTKAISSTGTTTASNLTDLTAVTSPKQTLLLGNAIQDGGGKTTLPVTVVNRGLTQSYTLWQIGIYAQDPDVGEILYCISQATQADIVPSESQNPNFTIYFNFKFALLNASDVTVQLNLDGMVTQGDLVNHNKATDAHKVLFDKKMDLSAASSFATAAQGTKADNALPASEFTPENVLLKVQEATGGSGGTLDAGSVNGRIVNDAKTDTNSIWTASKVDTEIDSRIGIIPDATTTARGLMTTTQVTKLNGIATGANKYVHPTSHAASMITQNASYRFCTDTEKSTWNGKAAGNHTHADLYYTKSDVYSKSESDLAIDNKISAIPNATTTARGLMTTTQVTKLNGIATGANNYTHPSSHPASMITQSSTYRFCTDTEKSTWNGKAASNHNHDSTYLGKNAVAADSSKLGGQLPSYYTIYENLVDAPFVEQSSGVTSGYKTRGEKKFFTFGSRRDNAEVGCGQCSLTSGFSITAAGTNAAAFGNGTIANGDASFASGSNSKAFMEAAHAEGLTTTANNIAAHAEGGSTNSYGQYAHAEGYGTSSSGNAAHAEGCATYARGEYAHAEGFTSQANGVNSHAEGAMTIAGEDSAHAEGLNTQANGKYAHSEGYLTRANGEVSHTEGFSTSAEDYAHASGYHTTAKKCNFVAGIYNRTPTATDVDVTTGDLFVLGNGNSSARSNAFRIQKDGTVNATKSFNSTGADYAELYEWEDGNPAGEDRVGRFVSLNGERIHLSSAGEEPWGIISAEPGVLGDAYNDQWHQMYLVDVFGRRVVQDGQWVINPEYDPDQSYLPRQERPEWAAVATLGKLVLIDDGSCVVNGYCEPKDDGIATVSTSKTAYRVLKRIDTTHVRVAVK